MLAELAGWRGDAAARHRRRRALPAYRVPASWPAKLADPCTAFAWSDAAGRLRLWSAAGYLLADVPRDGGPPSRQARRELTRLLRGRDRLRPRRETARAGLESTRETVRRGLESNHETVGIGLQSPPLRLTRAPAAAAPLLATPLPPLPSGCPPHLGHWLAAALPAVRRRLLLALVGSGSPLARALAAPPGSRRDPVARALAARGRLHVTPSHVDLVLPLAAADLRVRRAGLDRDPGWLPAWGRVVSFHYV